MKAEFKDRFRQILSLRNMTQAELAEKTGIHKAQISSWLNGKYKPRQTALTQLGEALGVSEVWLMGFDVPLQNPDKTTLKEVPLVGEIACGTPILANQKQGEFALTTADTRADFCLIAHGDSMIDANINDGDVVFCRRQDSVENGEIAAVLIDDGAEYSEATLKRVYFYPEQSRIILVAENPNVQALTFAGETINKVRIIGKAVACQKKIK